MQSWPLAAALVFLLMNILFVLVEYALVRMPASRVEILVRQGHRRGKLLQNMLAHLDGYLSAVQLGITIASLGLGWVGEPAIAAHLRPFFESVMPASLLGAATHAVSVGLAFAFLTFVQIVVGELVPRAIVIQNVEPIALWAAWPFEVFYRIFRAPILLMSKTSTAIVRLLGFRPASEHEEVFSEEEIRLLLGTSQEKGLLPLDRFLLIENLFDFGALKVRDAMVPRDKIDYLSLTRSWEENLQTVRAHRFSRYPLCETDLSAALGYVHLKDLAIWAMEGKPVDDLRALRRDIPSVFETEPLTIVFKSMLAKGRHMALVKDPAGRVSGLLTLEDVVEELVGEIHDEFDIPHAWSLSGLLTPEHLELDLKETPQLAIRQLIERARRVEPRLNVEAVYSAVWEREAGLSTAIGKGVAVPHARLPELDRPFVAVGRSLKGVSFPHPDKAPVRLVFLILTPASAPREQIRLLSRIAVLGSNDSLRRRLLRAKSPEGFLETLRTTEAIISG